MTKFIHIKRLLIATLLWCLLGLTAYTQGAVNPFELEPRLESAAIRDSVAIVPVSTNPFDIVAEATSGQPSKGPGFQIRLQKNVKQLTAKEKESNYRRFLFVSILIMFIILTLIVTIFRVLIEKIWKAFLNDNLLNQLHREQSSGLALAYMILYLLFFINAGLFAFLAARHFGISFSLFNLYALLMCMGSIAGFFVAKHFVLWLAGFIFPIEKEVDSYQFTIMIFNIIIGLLLVPVVLFIAYAPQSTTEIVVYGALGMLGLVYLFLNLRGLFIANRFIASNKFHFLLYLCAVEIAPILAILKIATAYGGS
ncbi:MAG: DUF4271 domain-containing protein [Saprospiraceae bacterium]|nr:DUF4271 domain-containing protein [Saprospiraceae bacterium]MCF8252120.1 DUF4271 domain-containing protein [Saprospiraceae bacterium]MCF8281844.1 DUF4271 domain-containing protein [Bacteroidales bacterium]MCF8313802.1 DUF4271 domain-containing protein [Saprospiraceae bacterium]MCF8442495.1 DUF4271 domain-containing protein [Saprospiraceae bacterium]